MTTVSAEAKLIPKPPALVDNRKQKSYEKNEMLDTGLIEQYTSAHNNYKIKNNKEKWLQWTKFTATSDFVLYILSFFKTFNKLSATAVTWSSPK